MEQPDPTIPTNAHSDLPAVDYHDIAATLGIPGKLRTPINIANVQLEKGVKTLIKELLNAYGWFTWMPAANGYGSQGVPDHLAIRNGVFLAVEAKKYPNKPRPLQKAFAGHIIANSGFAFCVDETRIDQFADWLESFEAAVIAQTRGEAVPDFHGARMLDCMNALTDLFK